jgi:hypothetical protein
MGFARPPDHWRKIAVSGLVGAAAGSSIQGIIVVTALFLGAAIVLLPEIGTLGCLAVRPLVDVFWNQKAVGLGGLDVNLQSLVGILVPFSLIVVGVANRWPRPDTLLTSAVGGYIAVSLLGVATGPIRGLAIADFARISMPFVFLWAGAGIWQSGISPRMVAFVVASYAILPFGAAILQWLGILEPVAGAVTSPIAVLRISGLYQHPYDTAIRCSIAFPFALCLARLLDSPRLRAGFGLWGWVLAITGILALVRTCCVAIGVQAATWLSIHKRRGLAMAFVVLAIASVGIVPPLRAIFSEALRPLQEGSIYELGTGRAMLFVAQASAFRAASPAAKFVGRGLHSVPQINVEYSPIPAVSLRNIELGEGNVGAHDQYLRALSETGIVGLVLVLFILIRSAVLVRRVMQFSDRGSAEFAAATLTVLIAVAVNGLSYQPLDQPAVTWALWLCVGFATASIVNKERSQRDGRHAI